MADVHSVDTADTELLARICRSHKTTSDRIRALAAAGWSRAKIAKALEKRYQHVRNVLVADEARMVPESEEAASGAMMGIQHSGAEAVVSSKPAGTPTEPVSPEFELKPHAGEASGAFIQRVILAGTSIKDAELAGIVVKHFPGHTTTSKDVAWNRWKLRQLGKLAPEAPETAAAATCDYLYLHDALTRTRSSQAVKRPVNLSISDSLFAAAKALDINLSETLERSLIELLSQEARARWLSENREALEAHDRFVERHGLWSEGLRQF